MEISVATNKSLPPLILVNYALCEALVALPSILEQNRQTYEILLLLIVPVTDLFHYNILFD